MQFFPKPVLLIQKTKAGFVNFQLVNVALCSRKPQFYHRCFARSGGGDRTVIEHLTGRIDAVLSAKTLIL
jgi:hypothetical protein